MTSVTPASAVPPARSTSRSTVRWAAADAACGSTPRSKRLDASEDSLWRRAVRAMETRVEVRGLDDDVGGAGVGVVVGDLGVGAAHDAREADRAAVVGDHQVLGVERALDAVEGGELLALLGPAHADRALDEGAVVGVQGLAELQHHVVGDVDGERDRAHARLLQPALQPDRGAGLGVETGDRARGEAVAADRVGDLDRVAVRVRRGHVEQRRVAQRQAVRDGGLAGHAAQRQAVAAVRR